MWKKLSLVCYCGQQKVCENATNLAGNHLPAVVQNYDSACCSVLCVLCFYS